MSKMCLAEVFASAYNTEFELEFNRGFEEGSTWGGISGTDHGRKNDESWITDIRMSFSESRK